MNIKKPLRWLAIVAGLFVLLLIILTSVAIYNSRFELNSNGVHQRLYVPIGQAYAKVAMHAGTGDGASLPGFLDGPIVRKASDGIWSASWFCEDRVQQQQLTGSQLTIDCAGKRSAYPIGTTMPAVAGVMPMPDRVAVLSDIEGNLAFLDGALAKLGVTDGGGAWAYGQGHLVIVGDAVDRGRDAFAVLWRLYSLAQEAQRAGGGVHMVLGNHEQYILRGNTSRAHLEHLYALGQMGGPVPAFAGDTVIGAWLRAQPVILQFGSVLFTHGGISKATADSGLTVPQLNEAMRNYWSGTPAAKPALDAVLGRSGVTQYRGYLDQESGLVSAEDVQHVLARFGATTVVVGHTLVDKVTMLHDGRVIAVDVNTNEAADEALVFEQGKPRVVAVVDRGLPPEEGPRGRMRDFQFADAQDWRALGRTVWRTYELARLPHPY
ncbi:Calcineurin-like phosphoesterase [Duganella sp. CF458]|uniref:metallophosphoesterase n=1 Tax=Duganella sp. CF458 TaxID=1884368 RepID=UPI0008E30D84|nr:metallophosphoesterase [Duganella sp. CF458]SFH01863.1 Calcineurin-like phosphoesterase [Duganella sp. CF458]